MSDLYISVPHALIDRVADSIAERDFDRLAERTVIDASWKPEALTAPERPPIQRCSNRLQARCLAVASPTPPSRRTDLDAGVRR